MDVTVKKNYYKSEVRVFPRGGGGGIFLGLFKLEEIVGKISALVYFIIKLNRHRDEQDQHPGVVVGLVERLVVLVTAEEEKKLL